MKRLCTRIKLDRQVIIKAAAEIADLKGLDQVTLTEVAEHVGVRKPSLYNHINGLPELKGQLAIWGTNQLRITISDAAIGKARQDAIVAIANAYRLFAKERPGLYRAIVSSPDRENLELQAAIQQLMAVLSMVLEPYNLSASDKTHAIRGLRSLMHGFASLQEAGWFSAPLDREESYQRLVNIFIRGISES
ncbi:putative transcriptional regulator, TetR family [Candidatus Desulfosporosinus infrequens]|uniref:Putative transcriptional regulator, TetR family n=1 Tax=Candidatus Desulfosporosinus infrequens TaxID=2043169 RepID=A0A2U3LS72_9FIRM|nr:putative transcriptional regulator, TetR family [Candidatus Desulfosporosinus infrequens]